MSIESKCGACIRGDHARHDRDHGIIPGLLGGTYCGCEGEPGCSERAAASAERLAEMFRVGPVTSVDPPKETQ